MTFLKLILFLGAIAGFSIPSAMAKDAATSLDCFKSTSTGKWLNKLDPATFLGASESGSDKMQTQKPWPLTVSTTADGTVSVKTGGKLEKKDASPLDVEISHVFANGDASNRISSVKFGYETLDDPINEVPARNGHTIITETSEPRTGRTLSIKSQGTDKDYDEPRYTNRYANTRTKNYEINIGISDIQSQLSPCAKQKSVTNRILSNVDFGLPFPASTEKAKSIDLKMKLDGYLLSNCGLAVRLSNMSLSYASIGKVSDHEFRMAVSLEKFEGMDPLIRGLLMIFDENIKIAGDIHGPNLLDMYMNASDDTRVKNPASFKVENLHFRAKNKFGSINIKGNVGIHYGKGSQLYLFSSYDLNVDVQNYNAQKSLIMSQESPVFAGISTMNSVFPDADAFAAIDDKGTAHWHLVLDKSGKVTANGKIVPNAEALK